MTAVRLPLLLGAALLAAAGCAQQPTKPDHARVVPPATAPAAAATAAPTAAAATSGPVLLASAFPPRVLAFAYEQGWRQVVVSGNRHYFCRADAPPGSLIASHRCVTQADLETAEPLARQEQERLLQPIPYLPKRYP